MSWIGALTVLFRRKAEAATVAPLAAPPGVRLGLPARADPTEMVAPIGSVEKCGQTTNERQPAEPPPIIGDVADAQSWSGAPLKYPAQMNAVTLYGVPRDQVAKFSEVHHRAGSPFLKDMTCAIKYIDTRDEESTRRITVYNIERRFNVIYIMAFCHERQEPRTFRLDRIQTCHDCSTGEIIDLLTLIQILGPAESQQTRNERVKYSDVCINTASMEPPPRSAQEPPTKIVNITIDIPAGFEMPRNVDDRPEIQPRSAERRAMIERCGDGLRVLRFLALCDGQVARVEEHTAAAYAEEMCRGKDINLPSIACDWEFIVSFGRRLWPTPETMLFAFGNIVARGKASEIKLLIEHVRLLVKADGKITAEEAHFASELTRILREL